MINATKKWIFLKVSSVILIPLMIWFIINLALIYFRSNKVDIVSSMMFSHSRLFSSHKIILSASPSKDIPRFTLCFFTRNLILFGKVDPHLLLIFKPFGDVPILYTLAPKDLNRLSDAMKLNSIQKDILFW